MIGGLLKAFYIKHSPLSVYGTQLSETMWFNWIISFVLNRNSDKIKAKVVFFLYRHAFKAFSREVQ